MIKDEKICTQEQYNLSALPLDVEIDLMIHVNVSMRDVKFRVGVEEIA